MRKPVRDRELTEVVRWVALVATFTCFLAVLLAAPASATAALRLRVTPPVSEQEPLAPVRIQARLTDAHGRGVPHVRCVFIWRQGAVTLHRRTLTTASTGRVSERWTAVTAFPLEPVRVSVRCKAAGQRLQSTVFFVPQPPLPSVPEIVFIGDSLTRGLYARSAASSFKALVTAAFPCTSETLISSDGRSGGVHPADVSAAHGDIYVIELGTNDASGAPTGIPLAPEGVEQNLKALASSARSSDPACRIVFITLWQYRARRRAYDERIAALSHSFGGHVVDIGLIKDDPQFAGPRGVETAWGLSDSWHPNDTGHAAIAGRIVAVIQRLLRLSGVPASGPTDASAAIRP